MFKLKCLVDKIQIALTNRGHLIFVVGVMKNGLKTEFQKLLKVSKISEVEDIKEILYSKEWTEFEEKLKTEKNIFKICIQHCIIKEEKK